MGMFGPLDDLIGGGDDKGSKSSGGSTAMTAAQMIDSFFGSGSAANKKDAFSAFSDSQKASGAQVGDDIAKNSGMATLDKNTTSKIDTNQLLQAMASRITDAQKPTANSATQIKFAAKNPTPNDPTKPKEQDQQAIAENMVVPPSTVTSPQVYDYINQQNSGASFKPGDI